MSEPLPYQVPPPSRNGQLTAAAIILIVCTSLAWLYSGFDVVVRFVSLSRGVTLPNMDKPGVAFGYYGAMYGLIGLDIVTVILAPMLIFGAVQMLRTRNYKFCKTCAILAMLPITTNCCCIATLPIGIWLLVILSRPDVKGMFSQQETP